MPEAPKQSLKILIVEDQHDLAELYRLWLTDTHDVATAHTGTDALTVLDSTFDVVLLDRGLPDISSDAVLEEIRQTDSGIQVAIISGSAPDVGNLEDDPERYLVKPVTQADLHTLLIELSTP